MEEKVPKHVPGGVNRPHCSFKQASVPHRLRCVDPWQQCCSPAKLWIWELQQQPVACFLPFGWAAQKNEWSALASWSCQRPHLRVSFTELLSLPKKKKVVFFFNFLTKSETDLSFLIKGVLYHTPWWLLLKHLHSESNMILAAWKYMREVWHKDIAVNFFNICCRTVYLRDWWTRTVLSLSL